MRKYYCLLLLLFISTTHASVVVEATRVIFDGAKKNTSIGVENKDKTTNIVQSWLSPVDASSPSKDTFVITPPLFKLKAGGQGFVRIVRTGSPLPEDRESMFWLNIKGIPALENAPKESENVVQFAINSRIKFIYRPESLKNSSPEKVAAQLQWYKEDGAIRVKNTSSYYINFSRINYGGKDIPGGWFVAPNRDLTIPLPTGFGSSGKQQVTWSVINDYGMSDNQYNASVR
ncbi:fimbria/pilus periplasmic chaperone [Kluyvera sp. STS39-E]|uniref:fimbria/pilus periplasmic chaperone n=1 Tax=Kluyvera sp. STS39-E TaxID=3234748 RepID=UPI0034C6DAA1